MGKAKEVLEIIINDTPRCAGAIFGTPGAGKTTFLRLFEKFARKRGIKTLFIKMKECSEEVAEIQIPNLEERIVRKISTVLHFTTSNTLKPSFDLLITSECSRIQCLIDFVEKKYRSEVSGWIASRLNALQKFFIRDDKLLIYLCLEELDELIKRMTIGIIYALRSSIPYLLVLDDALAVVLNTLYGEIWPATTRPYIVSFNFFPRENEILKFDPVIIAPGGRALYKLAKPDKYLIMYRGHEWEIDAQEVYALAKSL